MPRLRAAPDKAPEVKIPPERQTPEDESLQLESHPHPGEDTEPFEAKEEAPKVEEKITPKEDDASVALQKQIEALKKSEALHKNRAEQLMREREDALRRASEHEAEVGRSRKEVLQSQHDQVLTALNAAKIEAESAKRDIKRAITDGDIDAQADGYERLAAAKANIVRLEDGVSELEVQLKAPPPEPKPTTPTVQDVINKMDIPESGKDWLRQHSEFMTNPRLNAKIQTWHYEAIQDKGYTAFSPEYMEWINIQAGFAEPPEEIDEETPPSPPPKKPPPVSAPVSREGPSTPGRTRSGSVTLNAMEREAAKMAGVTEAEYAKQKQRLMEMKANGSYGERP